MAALFSSPKAPPEPKAPAVIPQADDETISQAKKREAARARSRGGRVSTVLTNGQDQGLGG